LRFGDISYMERRYRGSIEYRDTYGGVGIVVPISGIAQHYTEHSCRQTINILRIRRRRQCGT